MVFLPGRGEDALEKERGHSDERAK